MESLLYNNIGCKVYKSSYISTVSAVAENSNTYLLVSNQPMRVTAHKNKHVTVIVKLHGVERALCRCGKSQELKYRIVAAIFQQQQILRVGGC
ncbi:hypothetical protein [Methanosarcina mazei]|uniref:Uncharacterized protein n=1 Tax=Methanosarcina mazei TaxID=2209 RepID=A0A0F8KIF6_METMZ|nr:hypothetical protein [Methanosarcina mazei]KKG87788.1 hypothetical protein DU69_17290 [Methanosarcina mazei]